MANSDKFNNKAEAYDAARPSYDKAGIDYLFDNLGINPDKIIADIGSGTGKLTELLLQKGCNVFAVEPNDEMRIVCERNLSDYKGFKSVNATAENTGLASESIDFVTVAQAFHWFDVDGFKKECLRILRSPKTVILMWNDISDTELFGLDYHEFLKANCTGYTGYGGGKRRSDDKINEFFDNGYSLSTFKSFLKFDKQGLINRALSSSYTPRKNEQSYAKFLQNLAELFDKHQKKGEVIFTNNLNIYSGII